MWDENRIREALAKIEGNLPAMRKEAGPFETQTLVGIVDALRSVLDEGGNLQLLLDGVKDASEPKKVGHKSYYDGKN
jgi:hypothetical protein